MKVNVPVCPISGSSNGVMVNGEHVQPPVKAEATSAQSLLETLSFIAMLPIHVALVIGKVLFWVFEFLLMCVIWREPGSKGFCAGLCRSYEKSCLERREQKALRAQAMGFVRTGSLIKVEGATSETITARGEMLTVHHVMDGPDGLKLKLTLFPQSKTVQRRIAVPYTNSRRRVSYSYTPVSDIAANAFNDSFQFCVQNVVLICERDIAGGLFKLSRAMQSIPVIDMGTEKVTPAPAPVVQPPLNPVISPGANSGFGQSSESSNENHNTNAAPVKQAQGRVVHMGIVSKKFGDKPAYQTYEVVVRKDNGEDIAFAGQQMQEKAHAGVFKMGDRIEVIQGKVQLQKTTEKGKTFKNTSNVFTITVLQSAT